MTTETKDRTAVAVKPAEQASAIVRLDPQALIQQAISENSGVETMERLVALAKDIRAENARDAYNDAMARFQQTCPPIKKTKRAMIATRGGGANYEYSYAPLDEIMETIRPILGSLGLSVSWRGRFEGKVVVQNCRVSHEAGHFEESGELPIPIDEGGMGASAAQRIGIATTYAKRYSLLSIIGITPEDDTDGPKDEARSGIAQPQRKSDKAKPAAASVDRCPAASPWEGDLDDIKHKKTDDYELWAIEADQGRIVFVTYDAGVKDQAAEAMSNARAVRIAWSKTSKGNAKIESLVVLQDA